MDTKNIRKEWLKVFDTFSESQKRWSAAVKAFELGYGGIACVSTETGMSRTTITHGIKEIKSREVLSSSNRVRSDGGGRKLSVNIDGKLAQNLENILSETTAGDPDERNTLDMQIGKENCRTVRRTRA